MALIRMTLIRMTLIHIALMLANAWPLGTQVRQANTGLILAIVILERILA